MSAQPRLLLTDLDGTLLDPRHVLRPTVRAALKEAGARGLVRAVATGRSLFSARRVLPGDAPIDYVIFSSGAGLCRWPDGTLLYGRMMEARGVRAAAAFFIEQRIDFMVHDPVPDSHGLAYLAFSQDGPIWRRVSAYREHARLLEVEDGVARWEGTATQLVAMLETADPEATRDHAQAALPDLRVVRTTSPIDHRSLWLEVFPLDVSKATAGQWLARSLGIPQRETFAVGNDYNDQCMLGWAAHACVVGNAPAELRRRFGCVRSHDDDGVADALRGFGLLG